MYLVQVPEGAMVGLSAARLAGREDERAMRVGGLRDLLRWLQDDPDRQGESRGRGERVIIGDGVAATYEVYPDSRVVRVLRAWPFRRR
jgi:hypothetical protein